MQEFQLVLKQLLSGECPANAYIDLVNMRIGAEGAKAIALALESGKCPAGLQIYLWKNSIGAEGVNAIIEAMSKNTACVIHGINSPTIKLLNKRNTLILKYPEFEGYIKAVCYKSGLYQLNTAYSATPRSLRQLVGHFIFSNPQPAFLEILPIDIKNFLEAITAVENGLAKISNTHTTSPTNYVIS